MTNLFGHAPIAEPFKDIANQRPGIAEEKARLCLELNALVKTPPRSLSSSSVNRVRQWRAEHKRALAVLRDPRSSRQALESAISTMRGFE